MSSSAWWMTGCFVWGGEEVRVDPRVEVWSRQVRPLRSERTRAGDFVK